MALCVVADRVLPCTPGAFLPGTSNRVRPDVGCGVARAAPDKHADMCCHAACVDLERRGQALDKGRDILEAILRGLEGEGGAARLWCAVKENFSLGAVDSESFQARSDALRKEAVICDDFMTHFLSYFAITSYLGCPLLVVVLPGCSRLWFSAADNARGPLLLRIRKQVFQQRGLQN